MVRRGKLLSGAEHPCDRCYASPSTVYCISDAAFLCTDCDSRIHASSSTHNRVLVCESCERAPAAFLCNADAASLCVECDSDIHSANPLARRHQRLPILPLSHAHAHAHGSKKGGTVGMERGRLEDEDEAASWLNTSTKPDVDDYLELVELNEVEVDKEEHDIHTHYHYHNHHQPSTPYDDNLVPNHRPFNLGFNFDINSDDYAYITHSVSVSSSLEVPESTASDISTTRTVHPDKAMLEVQQMPMQLSPMDREARVLRYLEKKKTRKFEKTIRYASRKAYAEKRPRIKGRFAKRTDGEVC